MVVNFLKELVFAIEAISDETIHHFSLSLSAVKEGEEIIGVLNDEGRKIFCLVRIKEDELEEKNILLIEKESSSFLIEDPEWKDFCEEIASERDKVNVMRNLLL